MAMRDALRSLLPPPVVRAARAAEPWAPRPPGSRAAAEAVRLTAEVARLDRERQRLEEELAIACAALEARTGRVQRVEARAARYRNGYYHLAARVRGLPVEEAQDSEVARPTPQVVGGLLEDLRVMRAQARMAERLREGAPLAEAAADCVRALHAADARVRARALCQALQAGEGTSDAGALAGAVLSVLVGIPTYAWHLFASVPTPLWRRHAAREYLSAAFSQDEDAAARAIEALLDECPAGLAASVWLDVARMAFGGGRPDLAERALDAGDELRAAGRVSGLDTPGAREWLDAQQAWLRRWTQRASAPRAVAPTPAGETAFAVLDYEQPDVKHTSSNIGDYVQTVAALSHLLRFADLHLSGDPDLVDVCRGLHQRVDPARRLPGPRRHVRLVPVNRDASHLEAIPDGTWLVAFGWYMHEQFGLRFDFPFNPALRPIFVSFHISRRGMLTPEAIEYLRAHGPVGCRDWTTVELLLGAGVDAFFSGCVTTTIDTLFPGDVPREAIADKPVAYNDVPRDLRPSASGTTVTHVHGRVVAAPLHENLREVVRVLDAYRTDYSKVVTSRLHCHLPLRALAVETEFVNDLADPRFDGLIGIDDAQFATVRDGLLEKLQDVLGLVLEGATEEEVYARWREVCAPDVARAEERAAAVPELPAPSFDVQEACRTVRDGMVHLPRTAPARPGAEVHVAFALDGNLRDELPVLVEAIEDSCSRPVHYWVLSRDHDSRDHERLRRAYPAGSFSWLPCDRVDYGPVLGMLEHITVSTMDRLLLPELLVEVDRAVYHDIDALTLHDISELYDTDLAGNPVGARSGISLLHRSGFQNIYRSARRLGERPDMARDLVRRMHALHPYDFEAFNAGVLVMDLRLMREEEFARRFLPFVECYGMNDQEVLNCYAGPRRAVLAPGWNAIPAQEAVEDPRLVHWAGPSKPWKDGFVLFRAEWDRFAARAARRLPADPDLSVLGPTGAPSALPDED